MTSNDLTIATAHLTVQADQAKPISPDLFGIFFEDINYAADGGLYADLIQNRSFEYTAVDNFDWNFFTAWELVTEKGKCSIALGTEAPIHRNNPRYLIVNIDSGEVGLRNFGYDGIAIKAGESYDLTLFARVLSGNVGGLKVQLESHTGEVLAEATLTTPGGEWTKLTTTLQPSATDSHARFVLYASGAGALAVDMISLFPQATFRSRPNGLRADLAQVIADLKPRFIRFPGGCLAHGDGLDNMYRWKDTIGPIETRHSQPNIWNYHQSVGLGYFEYFQYCEDIGAKPVPVVPAGTCCPNSGMKFTGRLEENQQGLPMDEMGEYVQEVLDLIEWANGPATSTWGAKRAEAGHPEPFGLEYLAIGNEDQISPLFVERFKMIYDAVKAKHSEIILIGTTGPRPEGEDYEKGWQLAHEMHMDMVDEHGYRPPEWYWDNLYRFDSYDRNASKVYLGEYAAHDLGRANTLRSALAEAAYMTSLERNGDIVLLSSYAPLLGKHKRMQWQPNMIYFTNTSIRLSTNYYAQQLFGANTGDVYLPVTLDVEGMDEVAAASCVRDSATGDVILKLVSRADAPLPVTIDLASVGAVAGEAACTVLTGEALAENNHWRPQTVLPQSATLAVGAVFTYEMPAHSLSVIRLKTTV
ncbi:MAG: alpha-N-arabinofuranosidase [Chloroflexi bacterium]|nr:alpha-N-arabinofuranosidase [Chloroflexota bacterium]MCC6892213.1 alpha-N-arabinofuranosidase [Anaerolineae bacterium]